MSIGLFAKCLWQNLPLQIQARPSESYSSRIFVPRVHQSWPNFERTGKSGTEGQSRPSDSTGAWLRLEWSSEVQPPPGDRLEDAVGHLRSHRRLPRVSPAVLMCRNGGSSLFGVVSHPPAVGCPYKRSRQLMRSPQAVSLHALSNVSLCQILILPGPEYHEL